MIKNRESHMLNDVTLDRMVDIYFLKIVLKLVGKLTPLGDTDFVLPSKCGSCACFLLKLVVFLNET